MSEKRGEKVHFRQRDQVALDALPSARAEGAILVNTPSPRHPAWRPIRWCAILLAFIAVAAVATVAALEAGVADRVLTERARTVLQTVVGPDFEAALGGAAVRVTRHGFVALEARHVRLSKAGRADASLSAATIRFDLGLLPLLAGRLSVAGVELDGATLAEGFLASDKPFDIRTLRIDAFPPVFEAIFTSLDHANGFLAARDAGPLRLRNTSASLGGVTLSIDDLTLVRTPEGGLKVAGDLSVDGRRSDLSLTASADRAGGPLTGLQGTIAGIDARPFLLQRGPAGEPKSGLETAIDITVSARRAGEGGEPAALTATAQLAPGRFYSDGIAAELKESRVALAYRFDRGSIEILPSTIDIGGSHIPFNGGLIDLSSLDPSSRPGFAIDLVSNGAVSAPSDSDEPPLSFGAKIFGRYFKNDGKLHFDQLAIQTPLGSLAGSLQVEQKPGTSPEVSFVARIDEMGTAAVKQLWPYWLAKRPREWVLGNLYGGTIKAGSIRVYIPAGLVAETTGEIELGPERLQIDFDYERARLNVAGDIPPLRDATGHLKLRGNRLDLTLAGASAYFPSGRSVTVSDGLFAIPKTDAHPLMATLDIGVSGKADAVAELLTYRPIEALEKTPFKVEDFSGAMAARVQATFGLIRAQNPPPPDWKVDFDLQGVDLASKMDGRSFSALKGKLAVDPQKAVLDADAAVDGIPMHLGLTQPLEENNGVERAQTVTARLDGKARDILAPGLNDILDGPVDVTLKRIGEGRQAASVDLTDATVTLPWVGWTKGPGVKASATFETDAGTASDAAVRNDGRNDVSTSDGPLTIRDFELDGDGFGASGDLTISGSALTSARFSRVNLSPRDRYAVTVNRGAKGYDVDVTGSGIDLRALIKQLKDDYGDETKAKAAGGAPPRVRITAKVETAYGFNDEALGGLEVTYAGVGDRIDTLDARGVTRSGEAVVASVKSEEAGQRLTLTTGDAGAFARFADIYPKLQGGLLNLRLTKAGNGPYLGTADLRNFAVLREERLNALVSARAGDNNQSLNDAVKKNIDLTVARFDRGFARMEAGGGSLRITDGVVRGAEIGSTFQGTVFDPQGAMNLTGTFMPAYGLNRIFGEIPIFGALLGNGRDRGLIGITYRLTGDASKPKLEVNPLSAIAPGVFRQIFEF